MKRDLFESWIKENHTQVTDTRRYPNTITTISNHLRATGIKDYDLYLIKSPNTAKHLRERYLNIEKYFELNKRGNNMYSRAFDLYIEFLKDGPGIDTVAYDIKEIIEQPNLPETEKSSLIQTRIGQGKFRENLVQLWGSCSVTGYGHVDILIASHIKPWNQSNDTERLDVYNGFLLLPNIDKVFDMGLISFNDCGGIIISKHLPEFKLLGLSKSMEINIKEGNVPYLKYHRDKIFMD